MTELSDKIYALNPFNLVDKAFDKLDNFVDKNQEYFANSEFWEYVIGSNTKYFYSQKINTVCEYFSEKNKQRLLTQHYNSEILKHTLVGKVLPNLITLYGVAFNPNFILVGEGLRMHFQHRAELIKISYENMLKRRCLKYTPDIEDDYHIYDIKKPPKKTNHKRKDSADYWKDDDSDGWRPDTLPN